MRFLIYLIFVFNISNHLIAQNLHFSFQSSKKLNTQINIDSFLILLRNEEIEYPLDEQLKTSTMITRLRKIFYGSPNYDKYLIKGVSDIHSPYKIADFKLETSKKSFKNKIGLAIKVADTNAIPKDTNGKIAKIKFDISKTQEVLVTENQIVDIGHLLCGLDAANHPHSVIPPKILGINVTRIKVDKNQDAVTWVGDLGSVLAEVYFAKKSLRRKLTQEEEQQIWDEYASAADNLGNIDSYILSQIIGAKKFGMVSIFLSDYYSTIAKDKKRYLFFAKSIGLEWDGKQFVNKRKMIQYYADQVNDAAAFYFAMSAKNEGKWNVVKALPSILKISHHKYSKVIVEAFFDAIEKELSNSSN